MNLSKEIAGMILDMLSDSGTTEIRRNDLAEQLGCVPSQINYVISSRFTPEHGYIVESRRGGGGYIKITRATYDLSTLKMHLINSIGNNIDERSCRAHIVNLHDRGLLEDKEAAVMLAATGRAVPCETPADKSYHDVPHELRDKLRANIFKQMLISSMK